MRVRTSVRTAVVAGLAALVLGLTGTSVAAHDTEGRHGRHGLPTSYLLDPAGPAADDIFPEGIAARGGTFYVGSTTDGTIYRGTVTKPLARPFLLGGADDRTSAIGLEVAGRTLFVAGGATGRVFAYDLRSRDLIGSWQVADPAGSPTFLNDIAVTPRGDVYVTDSLRPVLYRIGAHDRRTDGVEELPVALDFTGTPLQYTTGFNVNGIVASRDGRYLVVAQSNTRNLYRIVLRDLTVTQVDLGGEPVQGDGLVLAGRTLWAVERQGDVGYIVTIALDRGLASGTVLRRTTDPSFNDPTTVALVGRSLLVVNSQFGERAAGVEPGPFTVSRLRAP